MHMLEISLSVISYLNDELELVCLYTCIAIVCTQLNGFCLTQRTQTLTLCIRRRLSYTLLLTLAHKPIWPFFYFLSSHNTFSSREYQGR